MTTDEGRIGRVEGILEEIRSRLSSIENQLNRRDEIRFHMVTGAMVGVMITMWVTILRVVLLRM